MNAERLLAHYERIADAPDAIARLRHLILDLAVRGKLVPQNPNDEPASELLKRIVAEKVRLAKGGVIKKPEPVVDLTKTRPDLLAPPGWAITNLQSVCKSITDGDHLPPPKAENGVPFLVIGNVRNQAIEFAGSRFVTLEYYESLDPIRRPRSGDLLYTLVGSYGIPVVVRDDKPFCVQRHIGILRPSELIDVDFLARTMASRMIFDQATALATGIAQKTVPLSGLRQLAIPLPPLAEQHRIVAKVDELMALCDRLDATRAHREGVRDRLASASLARLNASDPDTFQADARFVLGAVPALTTRPDQIKQLRQTILNLAVRGKLVPQAPNDEPASDLLKRIGAEKARLVKDGKIKSVQKLAPSEAAKPFALPGAWQWARFADVAAIQSNLVDPRGYKAHPHIAPDNIESGTGRLLPYDTIGNSGVFSAKHLFEPGCLLYSKIRPALAKVTLVDFEGLCSADMYPLLPFIDRKYLQNFMLAEVFIRQSVTEDNRVAMPKINQEALAKIFVAVPPLFEQHRIVAKIDELMALCDRLEASLKAGDTTRRRLLDALLAEALEPTVVHEREAA